MAVKINEIFSESYLCDFNLKGVQGKKSLEKNEVFKKIFLKVNEDVREEELLKEVRKDLRKIKKRVFARTKRQQKSR